MNKSVSPRCKILRNTYPPAANATPPIFLPTPDNYTCLFRSNKDSGTQMGSLDSCDEIIDVTNWHNMTTLFFPVSDLWWYCGGKTLYSTLPPSWTGTCTIVGLLAPITLVDIGASDLDHHGAMTGNLPKALNRPKRNLLAGELPPGVWIDAIGQVRGIPNEYKLRNEIEAGFESLLPLFPWITVNKLVNHVNLLHYNAQRMVNYSRDAIAGIALQLDKSSLMAFQNRVALDMLLAEKGGVCIMFGDQCCTYIPNNTAPDGSITKALHGLRTLATEMTNQKRGAENPVIDWLDFQFGKWKGVVVSILISILVLATLLTLCGCCCIPCVRTLLERCIVTALSKENSLPRQMILKQLTQVYLPLTQTDPNSRLGDPTTDLDDLDAIANPV